METQSKAVRLERNSCTSGASMVTESVPSATGGPFSFDECPEFNISRKRAFDMSSDSCGIRTLNGNGFLTLVELEMINEKTTPTGRQFYGDFKFTF